ncbi:hypothetical protein B7494_g3398 [Chlorociboria aeruginascens]|nr:hypothetical protein B7494_g3398 [Chlorociboria aeruginascens]
MLRLSSADNACVHSAAVPESHVVHEKRDVTTSIWVKRERIAADVLLPMRIGLTQRNLEQGYDLLMDVSHPESENYAKHWTSEEVIEMFSPDQKAVDMVIEWLVSFGIAREQIIHSDNRGWLAFDATTDEAERLLHTKYHSFEHISSGHLAPATDLYHIPIHVQEHIDYITPGIKLLAPRNRENRKRGIGKHSYFQSISPLPFTASANPLANCDILITPECIKALYKVPPNPEYPNGMARADNSMGFFEDGDFYAQLDLDLFFTNYTNGSIPNGTHPIPAFIDGAFAPVPDYEAGGESSLDFQLGYPLIYPQSITLFQTDDLYYSEYYFSGGYFNTFLDAIDGLLIQSILIRMITRDNFNVVFTRCPYVTNVGATKVYPGKTVYDPESAVVDPAGDPYFDAYSSGGGFSNIFDQPEYQKEAVKSFFINHNPPYKYYSSNSTFGKGGGVYNRIGRGYPDVAANGDNIATWLQGFPSINGGTSASTPIFASLINRINEQRLNIGKNPVGFINPVLYKNPHVLNDITNGTNPGCGTVGFSAVEGWDPVTGLGTPNYPKMVELFLGLP